MSNTIPCPNPICTHAFTQVELQSAAQLLCPKCGFRMQGKAPAKPAVPVAKPVQAKPVEPMKPVQAKVAKPVEPAKPIVAAAKVVMATPIQADPVKPVANPVVAAPVPPPSVEESGEFDDSGPLVRTVKPPSKFNFVRLAFILLAIGLLITVAVGVGGTAYILYQGTNPNNGGAVGYDDVVHTGSIRDLKGASEKVYRLVLSKNDWAVDNEIAANFGAHTAWKHKTLDFWFALVVKDHTLHKPRDADMLRFAIEKLERHFGDALELGAKAEPTKVSGLPAQKIQFKGQVKSANWLGECHMFFKDGIAYYLFISSPDWAVVERYAIALPEKHFSVLVERRGWREQPPVMTTIVSANGKLTVAVPKDTWERANPKDEDENGELFAVGKYLKEKDNRKNATMLIFTIPKKDDLKDAMKAARDYVDTKIKNDMTNFKLVHAPEVSEGQSDLGNTEDVGNRRGRIVDLKKLFNEEAKRYYLMAVVNEPDHAYVVMCDCTWESRQIWRQDFLEILRSLTFKKSE